ncbi:phosphoribosyl-AMP cyclohydrolase [Sinobacterium caligoides]|uniref:Phosphoribosyl-AMP cyclohydrolase n=1 Tax=Sinobacterium caligoides TaxID=933926 RepID=A0A3N2DN88_9GAMM|nr:phosphoribosyl-AMP cyclohydrolase [Sinobacterium caligoides]ROS01119.1 phosphoribosyl-AMP cyclohydrolase [Sinobacterium caligoides]
MYQAFFHALEDSADGENLALSHVIEKLSFNESGLIPVITQDAKSKEILMLAWMNKASLEMTITTKRMTYWSRSRQQLWVKGETSGHTQALVSMAFDCDGDTVLCQVDQLGAACHTGRKNCFYLNVGLESQQVFIEGEASKI